MKIIKRIFQKRKNDASATGIIGGADGPIGVFISGKKTSNNSDQQTFRKYAKTKIKANYRPFYEIENHLIKNYNAVPYQLSERKLEMLKANVIINRFKEVLILPKPFGENPTKKQLLEYAKNDTSFEQARSYPAEKLGLIMKAYKLPITLDDQHEVVVELEMTSEYMSISDAPKEVADALFIWQGVSEEDVANESPRFIAYAYTLRDMGKI
ncbi:MAG TPA: sodium ion-translocating decarboxylase subunit beta [Epulopiscium sp.]|nr:sodium ion-translocating decarboxylase subunit beta [Candidatus Epulonipiscium sp.]